MVTLNFYHVDPATCNVDILKEYCRSFNLNFTGDNPDFWKIVQESEASRRPNRKVIRFVVASDGTYPLHLTQTIHRSTVVTPKKYKDNLAYPYRVLIYARFLGANFVCQTGTPSLRFCTRTSTDPNKEYLTIDPTTGVQLKQWLTVDELPDYDLHTDISDNISDTMGEVK